MNDDDLPPTTGYDSADDPHRRLEWDEIEPVGARDGRDRTPGVNLHIRFRYAGLDTGGTGADAGRYRQQLHLDPEMIEHGRPVMQDGMYVSEAVYLWLREDEVRDLIARLEAGLEAARNG